MLQNIKEFRLKELIIPIIGVFVSLLFLDNILAVLIIPTLLIFSFLFEKKGLKIFVIVTYLTLVGDFVADLRILVHIFNLLILIYLFVDEYEFNFSRYPRFPFQINLFIGTLILSMLISSLFSTYLIDGVIQITKSLFFLFIVYLLFALIKDEKDIHTYILALIISNVFMAASTLFELSQIQFNLITFNIDTQFRSGGLIANVNALAGYFAVTFPIVIALLLAEKNRTKKILYSIVLIVIILGLTITVSRSGFLALIISSLIILFYYRRSMFKRILTSFILITIAIFLIDDVRETIFSLTRIDQGLSQRDHLWSLSHDMIKAHPIFGVGPGAWGKEVFNYFPVLFESFEGQLFLDMLYMTDGANASHNFYLILLTEMGILGLLSIFVFLFSFFYLGSYLIKNKKFFSEKSNYIILSLTAVGVGMFIRGFFDGINLFTFGWISIDLPFWIVICILSFYYNRSTFLTTSLNGLKHYEK